MAPSEPVVKTKLNQFVGRIKQTPPQYSALKIRGKKAYELARAGEAADLKARDVVVHEIADVEYDWPKLSFRTRVSSGTYIRSMARDIGRTLGTGGYLSRLRREAIGDFSVSEAIGITKLSVQTLAGRLRQA
jgi:tRNA pseudouridine55 synthase